MFDRSVFDRSVFDRGPVEAEEAAGEITGTLAVTESPDVFSASGKVFISGSMAVTEAADTFAGDGKVLVSGILAVTEAPDTFAAQGTVEEQEQPARGGAWYPTEEELKALREGEQARVAKEIVGAKALDDAALDAFDTVSGAKAKREAERENLNNILRVLRVVDLIDQLDEAA